MNVAWSFEGLGFCVAVVVLVLLAVKLGLVVSGLVVGTQ